MNTTGKTPLFRTAACVMAFVFCLGSASAADPLGMVLNDWNPLELTGRIMEVGPDLDYIVIHENRIRIVDTVKNGKTYATGIYNLNGAAVDKHAVKQGKYVYVRAGSAIDADLGLEVIVAKEIYLLGGPMSRKELKKNKLLSAPATPWE